MSVFKVETSSLAKLEKRVRILEAEMKEVKRQLGGDASKDEPEKETPNEEGEQEEFCTIV